jgi:hypothetical protein
LPRSLRHRCAAAQFAGIAGANPTGDMDVFSCESCVLSVRGLCIGLITRPEESYGIYGVSECDCEASIMRGPWPTRGCHPMEKAVVVVLVVVVRIGILHYYF